MPKAAVFASGRGSNFIAIHEYLKARPGTRHTIACLVSDKPDCPAVLYARSHSIPVVFMKYRKGMERSIVEKELLLDLEKHAPDLLVLAGFMRLLGKDIVDAFQNRIVNIHPSLLPKYPGTHGIEESYRSGDALLGLTIHYVDYGLDTGPVLLQKSFERSGSESLEEIELRIHELEHTTYPLVVAELLDRILVETEGGSS